MAAPENSPFEDPQTGPDHLKAASDAPIFEEESDQPSAELEQHFKDAEQAAQIEDLSSDTVRTTPPGPGLIESFCWMLGVFGAHFTGIILFIVGAVVYLFFTTDLGRDALSTQNEITDFLNSHPLEAAGVEQAVFVLIGMAAVGLRLGKGTLAKLNMQPFAWSTGLLFLISVLPLSMLSGEFYRVTFEAWSVFAEQIPLLKQFNEMQTMEVVKQMAETSPLWALILVIAVFPAIGEEIIFRGVIGRGLLARWGLIPGIIITSIMFGIVHAHPAHAIAVIPLGMFMHFAYYVTRSFWAPILVHFLNNAFAVTMAKTISELPEKAAKLGDETQPVHPLILISAVLFLVVVCLYLWKTRVRYLTQRGVEWTPGYVSNEKPPVGQNITEERGTAGFGYFAALFFLYLNFLTVISYFGLQ